MRNLLRNPNDDPRISTLDELVVILDRPRSQVECVIDDPARQYFFFKIPKKNGGARPIHAPSGLLKKMQRSLLAYLYHRFRVPGYMHGGLPKRTIFTNARPHVGRKMVGVMDVRSFFPSTTIAHIIPVFEAAGFEGEALEAVVNLTTLDGCLGQGSPSSCFLANFAFVAADKPILRLCSRLQLGMTRWIDDISISGNTDFRSLKGPLTECITSAGFAVAAEKTKFRTRAQRQVVTGLLVNSRLRPTRQYRHELKALIWLCKDHSVALAAASENMTVRKLSLSLNSKIQFLRQSDPETAKKLRGLLCSIDWNSRSVPVVDLERTR